ncbi:MAG: hypothetical protein MUF15_06705 [Acidobacteria bacterium]|nr:hypothetical protein [Acidobacteriota bacterium]
MTNLRIQNNLDAASARNFLYRGPGVQLPGIPIPPGGTQNIGTDINDISYSFNIDEARIQNSSLAVSLKDFSHTMELVDTNDFVLLRFVPLDDAEPLSADIKVECLPQPVTFGVNSSTTFRETAIAFSPLQNPRNANLKRIYPILNPVVFNAQHPITNTNSRINVGALSPTEILEIYLEGAKLEKSTKFEIFVKGIPLKITFLDYGISYGSGITPHIEANIEFYPPAPGNINITIQGDE